MKNHSLLNEKYRPSNLENYVGNEGLKQKLQQSIDNNDIQNFLFFGPAGGGKTTLAKILVNNINCDHIFINASDERGIEVIRDKVASFASVASFKPLKIVVLDEADFLTINAQASLRHLIEQFSGKTRFILTCNYLERIIDPLQSRCQVLGITPPSKQEVARHLSQILTNEGTEFKNVDLVPIVNKFYPDLRKCLNTIQVSTIDDVLTLDPKIWASSTYMDEVISEMSKPSPQFEVIRQIIADSNESDFESFIRYLFDNAQKYLPGKIGTAAIIINDHQYKAQFRIDKEINVLSLIQSLINNK